MFHGNTIIGSNGFVTPALRAGLETVGFGVADDLFRHTAACQMLHQDVGLEDIAVVLRHRSIETTSLYAKVDLRLLEQVAQPWPEVEPC